MSSIERSHSSQMSIPVQEASSIVGRLLQRKGAVPIGTEEQETQSSRVKRAKAGVHLTPQDTTRRDASSIAGRVLQREGGFPVEEAQSSKVERVKAKVNLSSNAPANEKSALATEVGKKRKRERSPSLERQSSPESKKRKISPSLERQSSLEPEKRENRITHIGGQAVGSRTCLLDPYSGERQPPESTIDWEGCPTDHIDWSGSENSDCICTTFIDGYTVTRSDEWIIYEMD